MVSRLGIEIGKRGPFDSLAEEVFLNLLRTADWLTRQAIEVLKPDRLSPAQYNVLRILRGVGGDGFACQEIANRMITRDPDLTRLLDRLEERGLAIRERDRADRRVVKTRITDIGLALLGRLDEPIRAVHARQLALMGTDRLGQLLRLLEEARSAGNQNPGNQTVDATVDSKGGGTDRPETAV